MENVRALSRTIPNEELLNQAVEPFKKLREDVGRSLTGTARVISLPEFRNAEYIAREIRKQIKNRKGNFYQMIMDGDRAAKALGITEHGLLHMERVWEINRTILERMGYGNNKQIMDVAYIANFLHDIAHTHVKDVKEKHIHGEFGGKMAAEALMSLEIIENGKKITFDYNNIKNIVDVVEFAIKNHVNPKNLAKTYPDSTFGTHEGMLEKIKYDIACALTISDKSDLGKVRLRTKKDGKFILRENDDHDKVSLAMENTSFSVKGNRSSGQEIDYSVEYDPYACDKYNMPPVSDMRALILEKYGHNWEGCKELCKKMGFKDYNVVLQPIKDGEPYGEPCIV